MKLMTLLTVAIGLVLLTGCASLPVPVANRSLLSPDPDGDADLPAVVKRQSTNLAADTPDAMTDRRQAKAREQNGGR